MSQRNFILLIIILLVALGGGFGYFYFNKPPVTTPIPDTGGTNFFADINPFGKPKTTPPATTTTPPTDVSGYIPPTTGETVPSVFKKVSNLSVAGFAVFMKERLKVASDVTPVTDPASTTKTPAKPKAPATEFVPALRYVDRGTGNIYETFADTIAEQQFSNTVIPEIYETYFGNKGDAAIMRYLKNDGTTIQTYSASLPKETVGTEDNVSNEITGSFLPDNISDMSVSPDTSKIFYLFESGTGVAGATAGPLGDKKTQIFSSPFTEWLTQWPNQKMITLTTKPSGGVPGYMYSLDPTSKNLAQVFGGINGLTTLTSPNGKLVLYTDNTMALRIYHTDTRSSDLLGLNTMPEKCIWGSVSDTLYCAVPKSLDQVLYPDSWYKGEVSFDDQIWRVDLATGNTTMLIDPGTTTGGEEVDGTKLALDGTENYLFFINKKDSTLWEFQLK